MFETEEARQELIARVATILHCHNLDSDFEINEENIDQRNIQDAMFQAAQCFRDTLIEVNLDPESAEKARRAFLSLKKNKAVEDSSHVAVKRLASRISSQVSKNLSMSFGPYSVVPEEMKQAQQQSSPFDQSPEIINVTPAPPDEEEKYDHTSPSFLSGGEENAQHLRQSPNQLEPVENGYQYNLLNMLPRKNNEMTKKRGDAP